MGVGVTEMISPKKLLNRESKCSYLWTDLSNLSSVFGSKLPDFLRKCSINFPTKSFNPLTNRVTGYSPPCLCIFSGYGGLLIFYLLYTVSFIPGECLLALGQKAAYAINRSPVYCRVNIETENYSHSHSHQQPIYSQQFT